MIYFARSKAMYMQFSQHVRIVNVDNFWLTALFNVFYCCFLYNIYMCPQLLYHVKYFKTIKTFQRLTKETESLYGELATVFNRAKKNCIKLV